MRSDNDPAHGIVVACGVSVLFWAGVVLVWWLL